MCPCCGIPVKNRRTFNDHFETQSNVEYCCEQCGKVFASKRRMYIHVQKYHAFKYHCQECDKICQSSSSLKIHYNNVHEKKTFEGSTCFLPFKWKNNLSVHEKGHTLGKKDCFKCDYLGCQKIFRHKRSLDSHMKVHEDKDYACEQCLKGFASQYELKKHKTSVHEPNSDFICQFCKIRFKSKANQMKHMKKKHKE